MDGSGLNERKKLILKAIIEAHVRCGGPVGSKTLTGNDMISLSPATIRNEMAELEQMGYLEQPHTSAGRVPSESGYRFYVDSLMQKYRMSAVELARLNALAKTRLAELDKLLDAATKLASSLTNYSALAVRPQNAGGRIDSFRLVPLSDGSIMLIAVSNGAVKTKQFMLAEPVAPEIIEKLEKILNDNLTGKSSEEVTMPLVMQMERDFGYDDSLLQVAVKAVCEFLDDMRGGEVRLSGVNHLLEYPEYSDISRFKDLLSVLEDKRDIIKLVDDVNDRDEEAQVIIGSESDVAEMKDSSIIFRKVRRNGKVVGAIGILGPRRMDYSKAISTVDYIVDNLEHLLSAPGLGDGS
ncbi:MAG: heat-inducible transcription repressor HrcA [Clostridia bacterium]|nr:heat-inducible transcription repressor HrcA [Clostridia bacterium]